MNQEEFESYARVPFRVEDATRQDAQVRRSIILGLALWGTTSDDLRRQLLASHPAIPSGFALSDFHELLKLSARISSLSLQDRNNAWIRSLPFFSSTLSIDKQRLTAWQARYEIVRRAIDHLESY